MPSWQVKNVDKSFNSTDASRLLFHFILGIGVGLTRDTSTLMVAQYFKRRREFVEIFVVAASGLGIALMSTFIFQATRYYHQSDDFFCFHFFLVSLWSFALHRNCSPQSLKIINKKVLILQHSHGRKFWHWKTREILILCWVKNKTFLLIFKHCATLCLVLIMQLLTLWSR